MTKLNWKLINPWNPSGSCGYICNYTHHQLQPMNMMQSSQKSKDFLTSLNPSTLVILDIDSTLVMTHKRNESILHQFAKEHKDIYKDFCQQLAQVECREGEYGYGLALQRQGLLEAPLSMLDKLKQYWRTHFFSNNYLHKDILHRGALEFVQYLDKNKIPFVYLTGRPEKLMTPGTLDTLSALGFPIRSDILFMKPEHDAVDEDFKTEKVKELKNRQPKTILIDNEPRILNKVAVDHPEVQLIFVKTCHSPGVTPPQNVLTLTDFL